MASIHETAYPRLKSSISLRDLKEVYTPTSAELELCQYVARSNSSKVCFLVMLKTFQRLGYFVQLCDVPKSIIQHIKQHIGITASLDLTGYDESGTRRQHVSIIREFTGVKAFDSGAKAAMFEIMCQAAQTKNDLCDIINVSIEELVRLSLELPAFTTCVKTARRARSQINRAIYEQVALELDFADKKAIDNLLIVQPGEKRSAWDILRTDPGKPSLKQLRLLIEQLKQLKRTNTAPLALSTVADGKLRQFAAEAKSLDAARVQEVEPQKRYTIVSALIKLQLARRLDDLGDMLIKRMHKVHTKGKEALSEYRVAHQTETDSLVSLLQDILILLNGESIPADKIKAIHELTGGRMEIALAQCQTHLSYADDNYAPFFWQFHKGHRKTLFALLDQIEFISTTQDKSSETAIQLLLEHRDSKALRIDTSSLDLGWVPDKWWRLLTGTSKREPHPPSADWRHFEVCVFSHIVHELKSGDLCIPGSDKYSDYREQLISWDEYEKSIQEYATQAGLNINADQFVAQFRESLEQTASAVDQAFPTNEAVRIENGEPIITRLTRKETSPQLKLLEQILAEKIEPISILDVLADSEHWLNWTRHFGSISGNEPKINNPRPRYLSTVFCYGCGLGPTQAARSLKIVDRRQLAWINQRHVTEDILDKIITEIINKYNQFALPKLWGSGKSAVADGTKWDLYEQNLLSEYHIRYGGYGGIGYYHVLDTYIALFSHFIPCGVWEAVYILDGLLKNESEIQPDTIHADTQGQSAPVFGLAHLLGINLMPRILNWKDLKLFRPSKHAKYEHIDELSSDVIDWDLIQTHLPDMFRIILSIKAGRISASTILRKLGTYSRKNKLYQAMSKLGRVVRTNFLLKYISEPELRSTITGATNKIESFNNFIKWINFGSNGTIQENGRDEQRKIIKYNHLVANCLILHNVCTLTKLLNQLAQDGFDIEDETVAAISPYLTEHVNRFGDYSLNLDRVPSIPSYDIRLKALSA